MPASDIQTVSGKRLYAIGDIHGCPAELEVLLKHLEDNEALTQDDVVILLGDYIDRGPDSKRVVDICLDFASRFPKTRFLKGNHEDMLLDFLGYGGRLGQAFLYNGGIETLQSYGISVFSATEEMKSSFPLEHIEFYNNLESIIAGDDFLLVHAGLNPLRDLDTQNDSDVFWIRDEFIKSVHNFEKTVIFGHTPHKEIFLHLPYKIGLDTGLVFGNKLTCLELNEGLVFEIKRNASEVETRKLELAEANAG